MRRRDFIRSAAAIPCAVAGVAMLPEQIESRWIHAFPAKWVSKEKIREMYHERNLPTLSDTEWEHLGYPYDPWNPISWVKVKSGEPI